MQLTKNMIEYPDVPIRERSPTSGEDVYRIPASIRPKLSRYRIELFCWGVRALRAPDSLLPKLTKFDRIRVELEIGKQIIRSEHIVKYKNNPNFEEHLYVSEVVSA